MTRAKITDNTKAVLSEADDLIRQKLQMAALSIERTAKQPGYCPVKTGTARRSIYRQVEERRAVVGSNVEYFPHIEMGTSKMEARAPLRRALEANMPEIKRTFGAK
jgi:HK97 gp10 family phage protein